MCFVTGIATLIDTVGAIFHAGIHGKLMNILTSVGIIYQTWAIGQFFGKKKVASYVKALLSYILGTISFAIFILIIIFLTT